MREIDEQFSYAVEVGDIAKMQQLWQQTPKPDVNAKNKAGHTPLHMAALEGHVKAIRLLKSFGADVNAQNNADQTPLHMAAIYGRTEAMQLLRSYGADVNAQTFDRKTARMIALECGEAQAASFLTQWEVEIAASQLGDTHLMAQQLALAQLDNQPTQGTPASPLPSATPSTPPASLAAQTATETRASGTGAAL